MRKECSCGYVSSFEVGFINVNAKSYASRLNVRCSGGEVLKDATTTLPTTWQTTPAVRGGRRGWVGSPALMADVCTSMRQLHTRALSPLGYPAPTKHHTSSLCSALAPAVRGRRQADDGAQRGCLHLFCCAL